MSQSDFEYILNAEGRLIQVYHIPNALAHYYGYAIGFKHLGTKPNYVMVCIFSIGSIHVYGGKTADNLELYKDLLHP